MLANDFITTLQSRPDLAAGLNLSMDNGNDVAVLRQNLTRIEMEANGFDGASMDSDSLMRVMDLAHWDPKQYLVEYPDLDLIRSFPVNRTPPPGTMKIGYQMTDSKGEWRRIAQGAQDLPQSAVDGTEHWSDVIMSGGAIQYNVQELDKARLSNIPLEAMKMRAMRRSYDEFVQKLILDGDSDNANVKGMMTSSIDEFTGLASGTLNGASTDAQKRLWANKTGWALIDELKYAKNKIVNATKGRWGRSGMTLWVSLPNYERMAEARLHEDYNADTVLDYVTGRRGKTVLGIDRVIVVVEFGDNTPFASDTLDGFMLGPYNAEAAELFVPMEMTTRPIQVVDLAFKVPAYAYTGGLVIRRPKAFVRISGV